MRRGIITVIFFVMTFFAAANDRKSNNQVSDVVSNQIMRYSSGSYKLFSLENQFNKIIAGSCLINVATAGTALTAYTFATLGECNYTQMYNFYVADDGVVPPAFDSCIVFPYNEEWEYVTASALLSNAITFPIGLCFLLSETVKLALVAVYSKEHMIGNKEALTINNATNINLQTFASHSSDRFYSNYMKRTQFYSTSTLQNVGLGMLYGAPITTALSAILDYVVYHGINGDANLNDSDDLNRPHHQLARMQFNLEKALEKIDKDLISDKKVDL